MKIMKKTNNKGFTLIELLVVIAIIGLLSTLAVVSLNNARAKSRDAKRVADVKQIQTALEMFYTDCNGYPEESGVIDGTTGGLDPTDQGGDCDAAGEATFGTFMAQVPQAPSPADSTCADASTDVDPGNPYWYESCDQTGSSCTGAEYESYRLTFCIGAQAGGLAPLVHTATPAGIN